MLCPSRSLLIALFLSLGFVSLANARSAAGGGWLDAGLRGDYYANNNFSGSPQFSRNDVRLDFQPEAEVSWGGSKGLPFAGYPTDNFSVRWTARLRARYAETYTFKAIADDSVVVKIKLASDQNYTTIINQASYVAAGTTAQFAMEADTIYDVVVEYKELTGSAKMTLKWSSPSTPEEVIDVATEFSINWNTYTEDTFASARYSGRDKWEAVSPATSVPVDSNDWPMADFDFIVSETLVPHDLAPYETGEMSLSFNGRATLSTFGNCLIVPGSVSYNSGTNKTTAILRGVDNNINVLNVRFRDTDRDGNYGADNLPDKDGITNLEIMRINLATGTALPEGTLTLPSFRDAFSRVTAFRFQRVNDQAINWSDRHKPWSAFSSKSLPYVYNSRYGNGEWNLRGSSLLAHEIEIMICNELGADYYVTVPHLATSAGANNYNEKLAKLIRYGSDANGEPYNAPTANPVYPPLNANLRVYVEVSNELWNFGALSSYAPYFDYRELMEDYKDTNNPILSILAYDGLSTADNNNDGYMDENYVFVRRFWGYKLKEISDVFRGVFGDAAMPGNGNREPRIRPYFTWQYGDANATASTGLKFMDAYYNNGAGNFVANPKPVNYYFWSGGGAGYYSSENRDGIVENNPILNNGFETPATTGFSTNPSGASWTFNSQSGIVQNAPRTTAVTGATLGSAVSNISGWVGHKFTVGATPITVYELGRYVLSGNSNSHQLRIARASDGVEVTQANVNTSGVAAGTFVYARCAPVTLQANTTYYLLTQETSGGDTVGDAASSVTTNGAYTVVQPATATYNSSTRLYSFTDVSGAGKTYGPVSLRYRNTLFVASGAPLNNPDAMEGSQVAWIRSNGGTQGVIETTFNTPATQVDNNYSLLFRWTQNQRFLREDDNGTREADNTTLKVYAIVNGQTQDITPRDTATQPQVWTTSNEWRRINYWVGNFFFCENFTAPANTPVTIRFETSNTSGDHIAYIDTVQLTSADAFYEAPIPSTGAAFGQTATGYEENQYNDGKWCAVYGLEQMTYEHGFSAGGDSGNSVMQNYVKFVDPRAKQSVIDAIRIFQEGGGRLPTFGTYSTWPAFESISGVRVEGTINSGSYALTQGMDEMLTRLQALPLNGESVPATIPGNEKTLQNGGGTNTLSAGQWFSYNIVVATPKVYAVGAEVSGTGTYEVSLGSSQVLFTASAGGSSGTTIALPWGMSAIRVKCLSGNITVQNVIVDGASQQAAAPTNIQVSVNQANLAVSLTWQDNASGNNQELWYELERATDINFTQGRTAYRLDANSTGWTDPTQLAVATTYYYRVRAYNLAGASTWLVLTNGVYVDVPPPQNVLYTYDGFGTTAGALYNSANGSGWASSWGVQNNDTTVPGWEIRTASPLSYTGLQTSGSGYASGGRAYLSAARTLDITNWPYFFKRTEGGNTHLGTNGTKVYISALARRDNADAQGAFINVSSNVTASVQNDWKAGTFIQNGKWALRARNSSGTWVVTESSVNATVGQTYLLVLEFVFGAGATDTVNLYVNPTNIGGTAPTPTLSITAGQDVFFRAIAFYPHNSENRGSMDDLRVGDSFAAVTPPASVATPAFSPAPGTYVGTQSVSISTSTSGASIRYTTDGSNPSDTVGTLYTGAINVASSTTIKAIAYKAGSANSLIATGAYTITQPLVITTTTLPNATQGSAYSTTVQATGGAGGYTWSVSSGSLPPGLNLNAATGEISGTPTEGGSGNFSLLVTDSGSATDDQAYTLSVTPVFVAAPSFSPTGGTYSGNQSVVVSTATSGASIRYTTDGSTPTSTTGTVYAGAVSITQSTTLRAIAYMAGFSDSSVTSATYTLQVAAPSFSPAPGTYTSAQSVTLSTSTSGASIRYTTDGSNPTSTTGTLYSGPINVASTTTLRAIAYRSGWSDSTVSTGAYTINTQSGGNDLLAEESFIYTAATPLDNQSGGGSFGWSAPWEVESDSQTGYIIASGSLAYGDLFTAGNQAEGGHLWRSAGRLLDVNGAFVDYKNSNNQVGLDGTTLWLAYVIKLNSTASGFQGKVALDNAGATMHDNNGIIRVIKNDSTGQWDLSLQNNAQVASTGVTATTNPTLMVLRMTFGTNDTVDLWVNPNINSSSPGTPSATLTTSSGSLEFKEINWYPQNNTGAGWWDEIRFGKTYASVVPKSENWLSGDIGNTSPAGSTTISSDGSTFTLLGAGADIWGNADAFHYARLEGGMEGDGEIVARVVSIQNTNAWAKAGVMIRETTAAGSKHAMTVLTPSNGVAFQRRTATDGASSNNNVTATAPRWVKITRTGNTIASFHSADGVTWTQIGSNVTISMNSTIEVGLCVTSHANNNLCQAVFDNISITR